MKFENKVVMQQFEATFGKPSEVVVAAGDFPSTYHMRGLLVDKYCTSKCCSDCGLMDDGTKIAFNEQFFSIPHPRYGNRGNIKHPPVYKL